MVGEQLIEFVRSRRGDYVDPAAPESALQSLGLDDATLARWRSSTDVIATLPHASPNVFFPRVRVSWYAGRLQAREPDTHHVRLCLTHVNLSDLGWRPYAWWYLDERGDLAELRLSTRNKKRKHAVVSSVGPINGPPPGASGADLDAGNAASWGRDHAVSSMLILSTVERAAGMSESGRTTYVPFDELVSFVRDRSDGPGSDPLTRWSKGVLAHADGRRKGPDGRLRPCDPIEADVFDHNSNMALLSLLGDPRVLGGAKMTGYWPAVKSRVDAVRADSGVDASTPHPVEVPDVDLTPIASPSFGVREQLRQAGIEYSQSMAVHEHGRFAATDGPFIDRLAESVTNSKGS
ncbi:hypothetical protein AYK61_21380 [Rhodococcus sp. SBT000017]|nr:hypothetical protein AYK61_21380 [Rhodococcus sp. SBT000017]